MRGTTIALALVLAAAAVPAAAAMMSGTSGPDVIAGSWANDVIHGHAGNDRLSGGRGNDVIMGGPGNDRLVGGPGHDVITGGPGADAINCGTGKDTVYADASDTLTNCAHDTIVKAPSYTATAPMTPRLQWMANWGYCGETAVIAAGMSLGQYTSQWTARQLANGNPSPSANQTLQASQLLLGFPATSNPPPTWVAAAQQMRLTAVGYDSTDEKSSHDFLSWVKQNVMAGARVIIGVYVNNTVIDGTDDQTFDHIVPVMGIGSSHPLSDSRYDPTDQITIGDNALYTPFAASATNWGAGYTGTNTPSLYTYPFGSFQKVRQGSDTADAVPGTCDGNGCSPYLYSIPDTGQTSSENDYGIAITGIVDTTPGGPVTIPVRLSASINSEGQQAGSGAKQLMPKAPAPQPMTLTATASIANQSMAYTMYEYTDFASVPTGNFNASPYAAKWTIPAGSGATWSTTIKASTGGTYVFRAVPAP